MPTARNPRLLLTAILSTALAASVGPLAADPVSWEPWELAAYDGTRLEGELGRIEVPLRRDLETDRTLGLAFARLPARSGAPGPPVVFLDGGPGSSPLRTGRIPGYARLFEALRDVGDVVLLDQRGVGLSSPGLYCPPPEGPPPLDAFLFGPEQRERSLGRLAECAETLRGEGVDLAAFDTVESADDVDALRRALGAETVALVGFSYGTHLGLAVARRHPETVARMVLVGVEGPDHTRKLPSSLDTQLRKVALLAARDADVAGATEDLYGVARRVLDRLDREPIVVPAILGGSRIDIPVSGDGLRWLLRIDLGDASDLPYFPALLLTLDRGDASLLAWFVRKRAPGLVGGANAHHWAVDAASGASPERRARIAREAAESVFRDVASGLLPEAADRLGVDVLPEVFRSPVVSDVPTLFVSGTLDANSPPHQAEEVRWGFARGDHLVVVNGGHEQLLTEPDVMPAIVSFLRGEGAAERAVRRPPPDFLGIEEALRSRGVELPVRFDD